MADINQLNSVAAPSVSDLLPIWVATDGATRKFSLGNLSTWLNSQLGGSNNIRITQYAAPLTGTTVAIQATGDTWLILTPAGTLAALTLQLPVSTGVVDKTELLVNCTQILTALTVSGNGASVIGAPTAMTANAFFRLRFDAVMSTWYRVG